MKTEGLLGLKGRLGEVSVIREALDIRDSRVTRGVMKSRVRFTVKRFEERHWEIENLTGGSGIVVSGRVGEECFSLSADT